MTRVSLATGIFSTHSSIVFARLPISNGSPSHSPGPFHKKERNCRGSDRRKQSKAPPNPDMVYHDLEHRETSGRK